MLVVEQSEHRNTVRAVHRWVNGPFLFERTLLFARRRTCTLQGMDTVERRSPVKPGLEGVSYEDHPEAVQGAQPHALRPLRTNPDDDGVQFPSPHIQIDAYIGYSKRNR